MGGGMMNQHNGSFGQLPTNGSYGNGLNLMGGPNGGGGASPGMMNQHNGSFGNLQQQQQSTIEGESEAYHKAIDGQLLTGLLCAALYPQIIAIEREETKKKKGINAPMKLRIRDKQEGVEIKEGELPEPTEVAIHPSSVNTKETKFNGMTCTRAFTLCLAFALHISTHRHRHSCILTPSPVPLSPSTDLIYHEKVRTTRVYVRDCSPVSAYALILFGGVLASQPGEFKPLPPPPPVSRKHKKHYTPPPPPPPREGVLTIDGWIRFSVSVTEQRLLVGVRSKLDALLASKIESPDMEIGENSRELLEAVRQVLSAN